MRLVSLFKSVSNDTDHHSKSNGRRPRRAARALLGSILMGLVACASGTSDSRTEAAPSSSAPPPTAPAPSGLCGTFDDNIQKVVEQQCVSCHSATNPLGSLDLSAGTLYSTLTTKTSMSGIPLVVPGNPSNSYLSSKLTDAPLDGAKMPPAPGQLTEAELAQIDAWIESGAPNGAYGPCDPPETSVSTVDFQVVSEEASTGVLIVSLFKTFPPVGPPDHVVQLPVGSFPATGSLPGVAAGTYTAYVMLDTEPFNPGMEGAEDLSNAATIIVPAPKTVVLMLGDFNTTACGDCALETICGGEPTDPTLCSAPPGSCADVTDEGVCFSDSILLRCITDDDPNGRLVSQDCSLTGDICGKNPNDAEVSACVPSPVVTPTAVPFSALHPIFEQKCSGFVCHNSFGFAQSDMMAAYKVVKDKDLALKIYGAIESGAMPKGFLGKTLCTGDPTVDTDPKCFTENELELLVGWVFGETGIDVTKKPPPPSTPVSFSQVHPILTKTCSGGVCHGGGLANSNIKEAYDTIITKNLCQNIWYQVKFGKMPANKGCTGDPVTDSSIPGCLNVQEHELIKNWVNGTTPCGP